MDHTAPTAPKSPNSPLRYAPILLVGLAMACAFAFRLDKYLSFEAFIQSRAGLVAYVEAHKWAALASFIGLYAIAVTLSLPGASLLTICGGFLFGTLMGGGAAVIAATLGAAGLFFAARTSLAETLRAKAGPALQKFRAGFEQNAASYLLFLRLAPVFPFWLVNLAPALLGVPAKTFLWTTLVGIIPGTFAFAFAGAGLDSVIAAQQATYQACMTGGQVGCKLQITPGSLVTRELLLALAALALVALIPVALKHLRPAAASSQ